MPSPYRIPGEVAPDREPQPSELATGLATLAYAIPDVEDELAPLIGPARIEEHWSDEESPDALPRVYVKVALLIALLGLSMAGIAGF